jgi:hypothetical protein
MAEPKTRPTDASVDDFINGVDGEQRQADCRTLVELMQRATGAEAVMWGPSIVGFGSYHYRYASGREGDWMLAGFSPRKRDLTVYIMAGFKGADELLADLGPHKVSSGSCLYLKRLGDVDLEVLEQLVRRSVETLRETYPEPPESP